MRLKDITEKYNLSTEEQMILTEYTRNRFDNAEEISDPIRTFLLCERIKQMCR